MPRPDLLPIFAAAGAACVGLGLTGLAALLLLGPQEPRETMGAGPLLRPGVGRRLAPLTE
jgi:hypothetical protein